MTPANVGRYMDAMERDLRQILHGARIARPGDMLVINLPMDELFEGGALTDDASDMLKDLADAFRHYDGTLIQVNGYTDTRGDPQRSLKTSQRRADLVARELRFEGVSAARITATGFGATHLRIATGEGVSEPRNRRIEIRIAPRLGGK